MAEAASSSLAGSTPKLPAKLRKIEVSSYMDGVLCSNRSVKCLARPVNSMSVSALISVLPPSAS